MITIVIILLEAFRTLISPVKDIYTLVKWIRNKHMQI